MAAPTCKELLERVDDPDHESQAQFARLRHGRMLPTCVHNGYTFEGDKIGSDPGISRQRHARAEGSMRRLHEMTQDLNPHD
jgi:hypothetical protein